MRECCYAHFTGEERDSGRLSFLKSPVSCTVFELQLDAKLIAQFCLPFLGLRLIWLHYFPQPGAHCLLNMVLGVYEIPVK